MADNKNQGSNAGSLLIVLIAVAIAAGGFYYYYNMPKPVAPTKTILSDPAKASTGPVTSELDYNFDTSDTQMLAADANMGTPPAPDMNAANPPNSPNAPNAPNPGAMSTNPPMGANSAAPNNPGMGTNPPASNNDPNAKMNNNPGMGANPSAPNSVPAPAANAPAQAPASY